MSVNYGNTSRLELKGPWEFYWSTWIDPLHPPEQGGHVLKVIDSWTIEPKINGTNLPTQGFASYRIQLKQLKFDSSGYMLAFKGLNGAMTIFLVDPLTKTIMQKVAIGHIGQSAEAEIASKRVKFLHFIPPIHGNMDIVLHISNFKLNWSGLWNPPTLSLGHEIPAGFVQNASLDLFVLGIFFAVGIYNFMMWESRRSDLAPLLLTLTSIAIALRVIGTSEIITWLVPEMFHIPVLRRLEFLSMAALVSTAFYVHSAFPCPPIVAKTLRILGPLALFMIILTCVTPARIFEQFLVVYQFILVLSIGLTFYIAIANVRKPIDGALINFFGSVLIFLLALWDVFLVNVMRLAETSLAHFSAALYLCLHSRIIALRMAAMQKKVQDLALENAAQESILRLESENRFRLASSIAHHLNNPLNYISLAMSCMQRELEKLKGSVLDLFSDEYASDPQAQAYLKKLKRQFAAFEGPFADAELGIQMASGSVQELRALSGIDVSSIVHLNMGDLMRECLKKLSVHVSPAELERIQVSTDTDFSEQIVGNAYLIKNALGFFIENSLLNSSGTLIFHASNEKQGNRLRFSLFGDINMSPSLLDALCFSLQNFSRAKVNELKIECDRKSIVLVWPHQVFQ